MALAHYFPPREPSLASTADMALSPSTSSCTRRPVSSTEEIPHIRVSTKLLHSMRGSHSLRFAYEAGADFIGGMFEGAWTVRAGRRFSPWALRFASPQSRIEMLIRLASSRCRSLLLVPHRPDSLISNTQNKLISTHNFQISDSAPQYHPALMSSSTPQHGVEMPSMLRVRAAMRTMLR